MTARRWARVGGGVFVAGMVALATAELLFRITLASDIVPLRTTARLVTLLGNQYADDEIHRLGLQIRSRRGSLAFPAFDPMLGWTARPRTPENPLGIIHDEPYTLEEARTWQAVLFFGDSFTAGRDAANTIPRQLEERLSGRKVLNFGVSAYGLDQMYLSLRSNVDHFDHPHVIVGIFYNDIDRVLFEVHASVKPWFEVRDGMLEEHGAPIPSDVTTWPSLFAPRTRLYSIRAIRGLLDRAFASPWMSERWFWLHPSETAGRRAEKQAIVRALVHEIKAECARRNLGLSVVLFPYREHLVQHGWYEPFMHELLDQERIEYLDLAVPLRQRMQKRSIDWTAVYSVGAHPSAAENASIAQEIAVFLRRRHGWELSPAPPASGQRTDSGRKVDRR